jgi:iron(III) transport system permease protein
VALVIVAAAVAALVLVPLGFVVVYTAMVGPAEAWDLLVRPRVGELLYNTVRLVLAGMLLSAVLGTAAAWLVERTDLAGRRLWHVLLVTPLAVPAFVNSYGWVSLTPAVEGFAGALVIVTLSYFPLVYLPVSASLRGLDPALEESAQSLGLGRWKIFARVVLPQLRPALLGGSLLVGLHLLAEFGALQMLRFPTFTTAIYDQYRSSFNGDAATMLASVLVVGCLLLLVAELRMRGHQRYARVGSGAARPVVRMRLGAAAAPAFCSLLAVVGLALGVPLASLAHWLLVGSSTEFPVGELSSAAGTSLGLALLAAATTTVLAVPVAWLAVRHRNALTTAIERSTYVAAALPGIVVALALVTVSIRVVQPLYQTTALLICAYVVLFLPRAVIAARAAFAQAPPLLDDVARSLGSGAVTTMTRVTVPLVSRGLGAGTALVFLAVITELTATLLLAPIETTTLATRFWSLSYDAQYGAAAPYAVLMVLVSIPATWLLSRDPRRAVVA